MTNKDRILNNKITYRKQVLNTKADMLLDDDITSVFERDNDDLSFEEEKTARIVTSGLYGGRF